MKTKLLLLFLIIQQMAFSQAKTNPLNLVPQPVRVQVGTGSFTLNKKTVIAARDEADRKSADFLNSYLQQAYGFTLDVDKQEGKNYVRLTTRKFVQAPEKDSYTLTVGKEGVTIEGDSYAATFNGIQTLIQLLPTTSNASLQSTGQSSNLSVPFVTINDHPRFNYRGMHLDVSRHFFPADYIKRYIDYLALHKFNYFHWHLTDDQGWRIQINKYPELTSVGGYRNGTITGHHPGTGNDNIRYGGFYTQDEVQDVVKYAADRHITVVPEIEMPGHASAAIAAYPWLSCFPEKETPMGDHSSEASRQQPGKKVQETWGIFDDIFCAGKDSTFVFLENVLDEVLNLFPSPYIHVGGDEAPKTHWRQCPRCNARMKAENLKDEHELQSYFIQRMEKYINSKGRTLIGWDEILEGGLAPNAIVMSWRGEKGGIEAAKQKHKVIMTPGKPVYFDHSQTKKEDSLVIGGYNSLNAVYNYEPIPKELNPGDAAYVLGAQANVWTEYMKNTDKVEYMVFPRISALSEVLWTPKEKKNWSDFQRRMKEQTKRYQMWKINYFKGSTADKPAAKPTKKA